MYIVLVFFYKENKNYCNNSVLLLQLATVPALVLFYIEPFATSVCFFSFLSFPECTHPWPEGRLMDCIHASKIKSLKVSLPCPWTLWEAGVGSECRSRIVPQHHCTTYFLAVLHGSTFALERLNWHCAAGYSLAFVSSKTRPQSNQAWETGTVRHYFKT